MGSHVFETMGTVVCLTIAALEGTREDSADAVAAVIRQFGDFDERYSLYRPDSELSRIARGELALTDSSPELRATYAAALRWRDLTGGAFTPHRPDGTTDLNGTVKALAMQAAAAVLLEAGVTNWCLNAGGDVLCSGRQPDGAAWRVGIVDPADRTALLCSLAVDSTRRAVATSGITERGDHIWSANALDARYQQATVVADDIETADVFATAIVAGGPGTLASLVATWSIDVLAVAADGSMTATPGFRTALSTC